MAFNNVSQFQTNETAFVDGKQVKVVSSSNDYTVIEDESGHRWSVKSDTLKRSPIWMFDSVDEEVVAQYDEKIAQYESELLAVKKRERTAKNYLESLFSNFGARFKFQLNNEQAAVIKEAEKKYYGEKMDRVTASNRLCSTCISKYIYIT